MILAAIETQVEATVFIGCLIAFVVVGLGLTTLALFTRKWPLVMASGMAWVGLGLFLVIEAGAERNIYWYFGCLAIALGLIIFSTPAWMREKETQEPELPPDEAYTQELEEEGSKARERRRQRGGYA